MRSRIADALYVITALVSLTMGAIYIFRSSFMPYHAEALQLQWSELDASLQVLVLALMDVAGAGWIALGVIVLALVLGPFRTDRRWVRFLIPIAILIFYVPTLIATLKVTNMTPATAPWYGNAFAIIAAMSGLLLDAPWRPSGEHPH